MKNGKVQIGIIGCGGIANQKHLPSLKTQKDRVDLVAFCDLIVERAEKAAKEYGTPDAKVYTDYNELLADPEIDAVNVLTPNVAHCPITVAAFKAGKHVICEKPMAHNPEAAKEMIDAWKASGKKFTIGYQNRFRPEVQALHKSCEEGELGEFTMQRLTLYAAEQFPHGVYFLTRPFRAAVLSSISELMPLTLLYGA